ncbi:MAG TPA: coiled-coil protein [Candidatus Thermoplasmatota archaeon]|nr:coiled-coil protein [Candidatus Thermoplasmatota archaeon]
MAEDRGASIASLEEKRHRLNEQAHRLRDVRDRLNGETRGHAQRRDGFNAEVRGLVERANGHKAKRDELNGRVREAKGLRDQLNADAHQKAEALHALRQARGIPRDTGPSVAKLRAEIRHLEFQQQTTVLTPKKEKELIDLIAAKRKELSARESHEETSADLKQAFEAMREAKAKAEAQHAAVTALANEAQQEHDAMVKLFAEADGLRKQADAAQADFVKSKVEADKVHREYIDAVSSIRDLERVLHALRGTGQPGQPQTASAEDRAEADDIFDKFRKGGKLSTEDLMALQKGGRL